MKRVTNQEEFWEGKFGSEYISRNKNEMLLAGNLNLFSKIINKTSGINSIIEFGSNIGLNLEAMKLLLPNVNDISAVEINRDAAEILRRKPLIQNVYESSIFDFVPEYKRDFVLIKGVLIHIDPQMLENTYNILYKCSKKYICIAEYYNPTPVAIEYRGFNNKLFKREFAGEILDRHEDLNLIDYGFAYRGDNNFKENDDITWFLMEKKEGLE